MKKRIISLLMLPALFLCSCGSQVNNTANTESAAAAADETVRAGFIFLHDENSGYDKNYMDAAKEVCETMGIPYTLMTNVAEGHECYEAAADLIDEGCNFIFADSFGHEDYIIEAAGDFPEITFCQAGGTKAHTTGLSNYHNIFSAIYEGRYLAGVAAGCYLADQIEKGELKAEDCKIGYVGAFTYAEVISGYTAFFLGIRSQVPKATMEVTFTGTWYDESAEKEAANKLISDGCVLLSAHADSMGVPTACEVAGIPHVSYNGSTEEMCPETYVCSTKIGWITFFTYAMECMRDGTELDSDWIGSLNTDSVVLGNIGKICPEGTAEKVEQARADIMAGKLFVFDVNSFTVNGETVSSYMADVDTDADYTGDTEVIKDGHFEEQVYRSAPYFDLQIDGITLLDSAY